MPKQVLVLGNKNDLPNAMGVEQLIETLYVCDTSTVSRASKVQMLRMAEGGSRHV